MNDRDRRVQKFEKSRPHLRSAVYRMPGSLGESDEAVQEAWLRVLALCRDPGTASHCAARTNHLQPDFRCRGGGCAGLNEI
jgi:hypothetical protein